MQSRDYTEGGRTIAYATYIHINMTLWYMKSYSYYFPRSLQHESSLGVLTQFIINASNFTPDITAWFISMGWYGIPTDGCECLYSTIGQ